MKQQWQQGSLITLNITDLNSSGEGVGRYRGKVVFVPDTVTGDRALVKLTQLKSKYAKGKLQELLIASEHRIRPRCIVADKCGGCQWQHIDWKYQREVKSQQVAQALKRIGGIENIQIEPIIYAPYALNYRNKATYPLARSVSGQVQAGYYRKGTHKLINLNQCPVQDSRLHPLLKEVKQDIQQRGWSIYNETNCQGELRHLALRIGSRTGEILLTLITTDFSLPEIEKQAQLWLEKYPNLVGVCLNLNRDRTNVIFGRETVTVAGKSYLREIFAGVELHIRSDTFFQVNTEAAELLLEEIVKQLKLQGDETIVDAYCGIGTFSLPLARRVKQVIGIESYKTSVEQARQNAVVNQINNAAFYVAKVEEYLSQLAIKPNIVILDPPRKGCDPSAIATLLSLQPCRIVYISCQPATLARDIKLLCQSGVYRPSTIQPADFFPQTTHVECAIVLSKSSNHN